MRFRLGRRLALVADVRLGNGLLARVEAATSVLDRSGLAFGDLPPAFRDATLRMAQHTLDHPPDLSKPPPRDRLPVQADPPDKP